MDIRATPLQIKTDSALGSDDLVSMYFIDLGVYVSGEVKLYFTSPMQYELDRCTEERQPLENVPAQQDKVWTISRTLDKSVKIECNGVVVVEFGIASCTHSEKYVYDREMEKMTFDGSDTATDFYRPKG